MRRLLDVLTLSLVLGAIALQGAFLTAVAGVPGVATPLEARAGAARSAAMAAQVCPGATDRTC